jgi:selenide, water dikinase
VLTNAGAVPGQAIVLTKPIGTGVVTTALKRSAPLTGNGDGRLGVAYRAAVREMTRLNRDAARIAREHQATAATDVTGFGLLGHLHRLTGASGSPRPSTPGRCPCCPTSGSCSMPGSCPGVRSATPSRPAAS